MPVFETYAWRVAAAAKAGKPDVYIYDKLPAFLRTQISKIFEECITEFCPAWDGFHMSWIGKSSLILPCIKMIFFIETVCVT
jgi:hypothetical protein